MCHLTQLLSLFCLSIYNVWRKISHLHKHQDGMGHQVNEAELRLPPPNICESAASAEPSCSSS